MENPIFIVGLPRSGSTLWLNIIAKNPDILRMGEMHFLTPWRKDFRYFCRRRVGNLSEKKNIQKMIELIFSNEIVSGITGSFWHYDIEKVNDYNLKKKLFTRIIESERSLGNIFRILIEEITNFRGYNKCCIKFPVYVNYIHKLLQWYPECKILHVIRDPRATAISRTNDPGGTKLKIERYSRMSFIIKKIMIFFTVVQYIWTSKIHYKYRKIANYALFCYEDLLVDPEKVIRELCDFTEMNFVPEMLHPKEGQASSITGAKVKGFDKKAGSRWRNVASPFEKRIVTLLTKKSMKRFGYDYKNHPICLERSRTPTKLDWRVL